MAFARLRSSLFTKKNAHRFFYGCLVTISSKPGSQSEKEEKEVENENSLIIRREQERIVFSIRV